MALYTIGDLHLSLGSDKPMDIFGEGWSNYVERIREGFSELGSEDVTVLCGDLSWGMSLEESAADPRAAGEKDSHEGESRLLVEYGGENAAFF